VEGDFSVTRIPATEVLEWGMDTERDRRETNWGFVVGQETICQGLKVPRQCPLVLLVEVMHVVGIVFTYT
jgi:hypothetical protein